MGSFLGKLFINTESLHEGYPMVQLIFLAIVYGYILCMGSNMVKDGSELLLLVPSLAGIVGSIVLPVLGAVPDGAIVLFSGLGDNAKEQIAVGIGALAGSTIMLLTVPWFLSIIAGRVNIDKETGRGNYIKPRGAPPGWKKLSPPEGASTWQRVSFFLTGTGVNAGGPILYSARIMLLTAGPFFVIQVPSFFGKCGETEHDKDCKSPRFAALVGAILASIFFVFYLWDQARIAKMDVVKEERMETARKRALANDLVSFRGLFPPVTESEHEVLLSDDKKIEQFLRPYFKRYDVDQSGEIDEYELGLLLKDLGENASADRIESVLKAMDTDNSGTISFTEFSRAMMDLLKNPNKSILPAPEEKRPESKGPGQVNPMATSEADDNEEAEEEAEMPEDFADLSPQEQQKRILRRSFFLMGIGVFVVLLFSDPMVDVLSAVASKTGIKPFFVAFCLAPLASNASEVIAAFSYALKKTEKTVSISFATLVGAACMNNTFCLAIFLFMIYFIKGLKWTFSAETISILVAESAMFCMCLLKTHKPWHAIVVLALFPLSVALVAVLEAIGLD